MSPQAPPRSSPSRYSRRIPWRARGSARPSRGPRSMGRGKRGRASPGASRGAGEGRGGEEGRTRGGPARSVRVWSSDVCSADLLTASASGVPSVTSTAFDVTPGTATQLAFTVQPANTVAGAAISPAVQVTALDGAGNAVPGFTGSITVALGNNPGGSTLGGTTTAAAVNGVASLATITHDWTPTTN